MLFKGESMRTIAELTAVTDDVTDQWVQEVSEATAARVSGSGQRVVVDLIEEGRHGDPLGGLHRGEVRESEARDGLDLPVELFEAVGQAQPFEDPLEQYPTDSGCAATMQRPLEEPGVFGHGEDGRVGALAPAEQTDRHVLEVRSGMDVGE